MINQLQLMQFGPEIESDFIIESTHNISDFDTDQFVSASVTAIHEAAVNTLVDLNTDMYKGYIDKALVNLQDVTSTNIDKLCEFYNNIYTGYDRIEKSHISIGLQNPADVEKIRPQYLSDYVSDIRKGIELIISDAPNASDYASEHTSDTYVTKMKRQLVKTLISESSKEGILSLDNPIIVPVTGTYIKATVIPYLKNFQQTMKSITTDVTATKYYLDKSTDELNSIIKAVNNMKLTGSIKDIKIIRKLDKFMYNGVRNFISLCSYVSYLTIRKMNIVSYNMVAYYNLYNNLHNYFPEGERIIHENAIDGRVDDLDDITIADSMLRDNLEILHVTVGHIISKKKNQISSLTSSLMGVNVFSAIDNYAANYDYDKTPYLNAVKVFTDSKAKVEKFIQLREEGVIFDDAVNQSGLDKSLIDVYADVVNNIDSVEYYISGLDKIDSNYTEHDKMLITYADLMNFNENLSAIGNEAKAGFQVIDEYVEDFENSVIKAGSPASRQEAYEFMKEVRNQYKVLALNVAKKLISRLTNISDTLDNYSVGLPIGSPIDLGEELITNSNLLGVAVECVLKEIEDGNEIVFESLANAYRSLKSEKDTGVKIIFEDTTADKKESLLGKIKKFIQEILDRFKIKLKDLMDKNQKWLADNKNALLSLNTVNTTVKIMPYSSFDPNTILTHINQATSKVKSLKTDDIYQKSQQALRQEIYPFIPKNIKASEDKGFSSVVKQYYTVGTNKPVNISISGEKVKAEINKMIAYCEKYNALCLNIEKNLNILANAVDAKVSQIVNGRPFNESVIEQFVMEASGKPSTNTNQAANNNTQQSQKPVVEVKPAPNATNTQQSQAGNNKNQQAKNSTVNTNKQAQYLSTDSKMYSTAILTAVESRYIAYISVLRSLIGQNKPQEQ